MSERISQFGLQVSKELNQFIEQQVLPLTEYNAEQFWQQAADVIHDLAPKNKQLLEKRDALQSQIDQWHQENTYSAETFADYKAFLTDIGYIEPVVEDFSVDTENVDAELATMAGPQLVVPIMNARFALNAVNARWGSLYDALYGSDLIPAEENQVKGYDPVRGAKVIAFAKDFLDKHLPLVSGSHADAKQYQVDGEQVVVTLADGSQTQLQTASAFIGQAQHSDSFHSYLFKHNQLLIELCFDQSSPISQQDQAQLSDILLESALTTIMDCEDSVAAVDAADKVLAYSNWLGLIKGDLTEEISKGGKTTTRRMNQDKQFVGANGEPLSVKARSVMFVRNVGHLMTNNAILDKDGQEVPEGILDAIVTSLIASLDVQGEFAGQNSQQGSIYIVKPKMHGSEEVAFANELFGRVEAMLSLPANTIKMGIMDEERRTSLNLKNCIYQAKSRVVFINTGFLDRTGDEIHTSMLAGPMTRKNDIKLTQWIGAYEQNNVDVGLSCGLSGKAQIGKGMWPVPDNMKDMYEAKIGHVQSGANTAWVPSPTAATIHALHYHEISVADLQQTLKSRTPASIDDILKIPLAESTDWSEAEITQELDNNAQGILGYVVRWIDQGVGCSKVPDINDVGLMEDRATLRISSQHIANWLKHDICTEAQVMASMQKMAKVVDQQNQADPLYVAMADNFDNSIAFKAACDLVFKGDVQPSGYTEPLLHHYRQVHKSA
ncbi:malate synthase G [Thalassotalea euphylliae]|uniref:Malate synthase G n=1 Tax=Thalassotalea euphylliae TaxID=1655234 RepID=A0A3E0U6B7_9GAMM|nr:malate synthase G [Thalassotalea euphylliae]REL32127.1 malate synthase G [Thalassotalea euphylliae]